MKSTPRWFWPAALVPLCNALALLSVHRYDRTLPDARGIATPSGSVEMALSLYIAFILFLYLFLILCWRRPRTKESNAEFTAEWERK